ncbi:MAG: OPT/YSL family transporter [Candidatus Eisenbacteria bacterium]
MTPQESTTPPPEAGTSPATAAPSARGGGLQQLTAEQVRTWSREEKDRWWLANVWRGNMPQLTLRAAVTGFLLGGILSATNLYVGAKTGWTLGVGITSVILAFAMFKVLSRLGAKDMTILENNCMQSIATAAGYMTGPLISGMAAYMMVQNQLLPWWQMLCFNVVLSLLGVLVAFPMKRRFINDEQQPFPEGRACGVVLDTLYSSHASIGLFKAKALAYTALIAGGLKFISGPNLMNYLQTRILGLAHHWHLPENLTAGYYALADKGRLPIPKLAGVDIRQLGLTASLDLAMFGAGGLMGIRAGMSMLAGMILNFAIIVPWMISLGEIQPRPDGTFSRIHVLNTWALWWGISIMVVAALASLFAKPKVLLSSFRVFTRRKTGGKDLVGHIELPLWVSFVGVPIIGAVGVWMIHVWFGVRVDLGILALPLIFVLTLIAANSTALTGITPTGSLSKIPQFFFGTLNPRHAPTNLMTALMCTEVASNASNLLMDIKPGYMLGAKPRQQAIGHCIGIVAGALASTPLFYLLFLADYRPGGDVMGVMITDQFGFPSALQWKGVSDLVAAVFSQGRSPIPASAVWAMGIAAAVGLGLEISRMTWWKRFPLSPLAIGLGVVIPPDSTVAMFAGSGFFWLMGRRYAGRPATRGHRLWIDTMEPICAGMIAGAALIGISDVLVRVFLL